ncbi:hypothetical protein KUCAC02_001062, partial [Chaenocephalus aceratus]
IHTSKPPSYHLLVNLTKRTVSSQTPSRLFVFPVPVSEVRYTHDRVPRTWKDYCEVLKNEPTGDLCSIMQ